MHGWDPHEEVPAMSMTMEDIFRLLSCFENFGQPLSIQMVLLRILAAV